MFAGLVLLLACGDAPPDPSPQTPTNAAGGAWVDLGPGRVAAPIGSKTVRTGTTDSTMGELAGADGVVLLRYDIGHMAGTRAHAELRDECEWFDVRATPDGRARTACVKNGKLLATWTIRNLSGPAYPANFTTDVPDAEARVRALSWIDSYAPSEDTVSTQIWLPRGIESVSDGMGGVFWTLTRLEADPSSVDVSVGAGVGYQVSWRDVDSGAVTVSATYCGTSVPNTMGPKGPQRPHGAELVLFETRAPCASPWEGKSEGYRELHRVVVGQPLDPSQ
jgi:hypothetical protein